MMQIVCMMQRTVGYIVLVAGVLLSAVEFIDVIGGGIMTQVVYV